MIDRAALDEAVTWANGRMRSHGGGLEVVDVSDGGRVALRFTGMCCGCPWKLLTWLGTVEPHLLAVPGVTSIEAPGTRISAEAETRWRQLTGRADGERS